MIFFNLATEDEVSESIGLKLIEELGSEFQVNLKLRKGGYGYLRSKINSFCQMALRNPILIITDLDRITCPATLIRGWMGTKRCPEKMLFRVAVRETESWLMADHTAMGSLLGKGAANIPSNPDSINDPKQKLLECAKRAPREVRKRLIAEKGALASQGLEYNSCLCKFVRERWNPERAANRSTSLRRARARLKELALKCQR